jgi:hypothetical protein
MSLLNQTKMGYAESQQQTQDSFTALKEVFSQDRSTLLAKLEEIIAVYNSNSSTHVEKISEMSTVR